MICENTISAGFYFMVGKALFDIALASSILIGCVVVWFLAEFVARKKK